MGLDMSIYRILPPVGIAAGDRISRAAWMDNHNGNSLISADGDELCDTIRRIGVQENAPHEERISVELEHTRPISLCARYGSRHISMWNTAHRVTGNVTAAAISVRSGTIIAFSARRSLHISARA